MATAPTRVIYSCCYDDSEQCSYACIQNDSDFQMLQSDLNVHVLYIVDSGFESESENSDGIEQYVQRKHSAYVSSAKDLYGAAIFDVLDLCSATTETMKTVVSWKIPQFTSLIMFFEPPEKNSHTGDVYRRMEVVYGDRALSSRFNNLKIRIKASIPAIDLYQQYNYAPRPDKKPAEDVHQSEI
ncbi:unnamed protein product [Albugo candida]|uniref:Uncharacterized protein n=1 Tax=Albugo candida TaxID=65357 RepID=A0A024FUJ1_9STRA|nr:unnamed protein product [Albugo candida]|eukprot:CCI10567.1 unnamed protein product [Albugo candida]